jgi:Na+-translocating ferredoxin:NAD+ oxidoreductase RNF subunit RnfB
LKQLINIDEKKCKFCYACVRVCPVKAIRVDPGSESPKFVAERCIGCGLCLTSCSPGAITYRDTKEEANRLLQSGGDVVAIVGPSISGEFDDITDYRKFVRMIKTLGFTHVNEISFGVDKVAAEYLKLFKNSRGKYYVTANCPVIVKYIEKYHPSLISNIAPIVSPMAATAKILRKKYGNKVKFVYIGPCIEAKNEAERYKDECKVDVVITFRELREMFVEHGITESSLEYSDFDQPVGHRGSLYPISEGFVEIMGVEKDILNNKIITADGKDDSHEAIAEFAENIDSINNHFNLFHCDGCLMGPGTSPGGKQFVRRSLVTDYSTRRLKRFDKETWEAEFKKVEDLDLTATFMNHDQRVPVPSEKKINEILISMGKDPKEVDLGCEACGYSSCRDLAIAVANGLSTPEMCNTYALRNKQRYIQSLKVTNEKLAKTQEALKESEKVALSEKESAREAYEMTESMLQKLRSGVIIMDKQLKIIHSNQSFINLLGDDAREINDVIPGLVGADVKTLLPYSVYNLFNYVLTHDENILNKDVHYEDKLLNVSIFTIKKNKIAGAILRDLYAPEVRRDEVINRVTEVIDNNLEMVQKIGFLLGEGAAETERMLNSIIESFKKGKHDK